MDVRVLAQPKSTDVTVRDIGTSSTLGVAMSHSIQSVPIFPTAIQHLVSPELDCAQITRIVYLLREKGHTFASPHSGVHQTTGNIMAIDHPAIRTMNRVFLEMVQSSTGQPVVPLSMRGWANISPPNDPTVGSHPHGHLPFHFSGVFYPKTPRFVNGDEGRLVLVDPREVFAGSTYATLIPEPGMMVTFPSWLRHTVNPFRGEPGSDTDRISVSMNVIIGPPPDSANMLPPHRVRNEYDPEHGRRQRVLPEDPDFSY